MVCHGQIDVFVLPTHKKKIPVFDARGSRYGPVPPLKSMEVRFAVGLGLCGA
jgi:hypothetical protein